MGSNLQRDPESLVFREAAESLVSLVASPPSMAVRIGLGVIAVIIAAAMRVFLDPWLGERLPYSMFFPAVLAAAVFGGGRAVTVAMLASTLAGWFLFVPPQMSWRLETGHAIDIVVFLALAGLTAGIGLLLRAALQRLDLRRAEYEALASHLGESLRHDLLVAAAVTRASSARLAPEGDATQALRDRLTLMHEVRKIATDGEGQDGAVRRVVEAALRYLPAEDRARFRLAGPPLHLSAEAAILLSVSLSEFGGQARRSGALAHADGYVHVEWSSAGAMVDLVWTELGGPFRARAIPPFVDALFSDPTIAPFRWRVEQAPGLLRLAARFDPHPLRAPSPPPRLRAAS